MKTRSQAGYDDLLELTLFLDPGATPWPASGRKRDCAWASEMQSDCEWRETCASALLPRMLREV
jgi:hypothetical protein